MYGAHLSWPLGPLGSRGSIVLQQAGKRLRKLPNFESVRSYGRATTTAELLWKLQTRSSMQLSFPCRGLGNDLRSSAATVGPTGADRRARMG